jgi:predicted DNA-binding ribbon-helix-helix protein
MKFNNIKSLFLKDVYVYDIISCHYNLLKKYNLDISFIDDKNNKLERNIQIGKMMKYNKNFTSFLRKTTEQILDNFIYEYNISNEEIILRQYDGILSSKYIKINNDENEKYMKPQKRCKYDLFIISYNMDSYIAKDISLNKISIKGMLSGYENMKKYYEKIMNINYANKTSIFKSLNKIKNDFMNSSNLYDFCIPTNDNKYLIYINDYGEFIIDQNTINILDPNEIDKKLYFQKYLQPFIRTIIKEYA